MTQGIKMIKSYHYLLFMISVSFFSTVAQTSTPLSIERIFQDDVLSMSVMPNFKWVDDVGVLFFNRNKNHEFEILGTKSNTFRRYFESSELIKKLNQEGISKTIDQLNWPNAINADGTLFQYIFENDIYLISLPKLSITRVTATSEIEKCVQFSPDSRHISFIRDNDIYIYNIDSKMEKRITFSGSENILNGTLSWIYWEEFFGRQDTGYWWSDDSKSIAFLNTDETNVSTMHYVDFEPALPRVIKQKYPKAGELNPKVKVGVASLEKKSIGFLNFDKNPYEYIARVKWLPDNKNLSVQTLNRGQDTLKLFFVDVETLIPKLILEETDTAWVNINEDLYFLKNSDRFIWASERTGYMHLYMYKMDGTLINQITSGDWACSSSGLGVFWLKKSIYSINEIDETIHFISIKKSHLEKQLNKINFDGSDLTQITNTSGTHAISFSPSGKLFIDRFSSILKPPKLSLHQWDNTKLMELSSSDESVVEKLGLLSPEIFSINSRDSFNIPARILKPIDFDQNKKYPVIIYIYGGPCAPQVKDDWQRNITYENVLIRNGFICVSIDHRGATGISKRLENLMHKQMFGKTELNDLEDAVRWLKKQSYVDADNIGVWGRSGGGGNTLSAMTNLKEFKAGIAVAGISDWKYYNTKLTESAMKRPVDNPEGYLNTSSVEKAANLHGRLMIIHGTYDDNVHIQHTWSFINGLIKNNIKFDLMVYPMRKHHFADIEAQLHYHNTMLEFWKQNLK